MNEKEVKTLLLSAENNAPELWFFKRSPSIVASILS